MPLTDTSIRLARARDRAYKLADAHGLWLFIQPNGRKWWRFRYRFQGVEKMLSFGTYPEIPLTEARDRREEARRQLATGINPSAERKAEKAAAMNTFETVARHWLTGLARHVRKKKAIDRHLQESEMDAGKLHLSRSREQANRRYQGARFIGRSQENRDKGLT